MALSICFSRFSLSLSPPHFSSTGGRLSPPPMAVHLKKSANLSNLFAGSSLSLGKNFSPLSIPMEKHSKLTVFAKKKGYKMKTHKASAKRFRVTGTGKIVRRRAGKQHLLGKKNTKRKNRLSKMIQVNKSDYDNVTGALPYLKVNRKAN
ncbi:50S ribosomal protein L35 [Rhynchospora pubera]|uniref:50S ribosomal protein L35 n=1 Tax=Rhynchospora pubera TaxID=906938 RepID=A0AAV8H726_9POAL|nr:50S ribosomal protein L35 [Rhynchospora pubera]